jgi:hypothetical protein
VAHRRTPVRSRGTVDEQEIRAATAAKDLKPDYEYKDIPGADHGSVIEQGIPDVFAFFKKHAKSGR